jgi:biopolymer transport protein ExbD
MAEIIENSGSKKEGGRRKPKKMGANIDMTPMVDLMCLLITFFMLTTAFSKPKVMEITMPEKNVDNEAPQVKISAERTYTLLLTENDKLYYYHGAIEPGKPIPELVKINYSKDGLRKLLLDKNEKVIKKIQDLKEKVKTGALVMSNDTLNEKIRVLKKSDKKAPIILIKADEKAKYKNLVDVIDEMAICNIASYAVVDITPEELKMLETAPK